MPFLLVVAVLTVTPDPDMALALRNGVTSTTAFTVVKLRGAAYLVHLVLAGRRACRPDELELDT